MCTRLLLNECYFILFLTASDNSDEISTFISVNVRLGENTTLFVTSGFESGGLVRPFDCT